MSNIQKQQKRDTIKTDSGTIQLSIPLIKKYLVRGNANYITDQECLLFLSLCKHQRLNPWINEAYLIKYGKTATMVVGKDVFTKRAFKNPNCDGWKAGITVYNKNTSEIMDREGSAYYKEIEVLIGGWCEVWFKDKAQSLKQSVEINEYIQLTKEGKPNNMWETKPATMIRKVAIVQTLREAFPDDFQGCYFEEEMKTDTQELETLKVENEVFVVEDEEQEEHKEAV